MQNQQYVTLRHEYKGHETIQHRLHSHWKYGQHYNDSRFFFLNKEYSIQYKRPGCMWGGALALRQGVAAGVTTRAPTGVLLRFC